MAQSLVSLPTTHSFATAADRPQSVCFDADGVVLKMGDPGFVQAYANLVRYMADDINVVTGPFTTEEFGLIRDCAGYVLRSQALTDPRFSLS